MPALTTWMDSNLAVQGYCLLPEERRSLRVAVRFSTALCLALVVTGLALRSEVLILAMVPIGVVAGWTPRHPFDLLWNHGVRKLLDVPSLPPNPVRRRHSFKLATAWLLAVGILLSAGYSAAGIVLGSVMVAVCALVTVTNFCIPSTLLGAWTRRSPKRTTVSR